MRSRPSETRASEVEAPEGRGPAGGPGAPSRARRIAFRVLSVGMALLLLAFFSFALLEVVVMWLPGETISSIIGEDFSEMAIHRTHLLYVGIVAWASVLAACVQLRKAERRVAPMLLLVAVALGATVVYGLSGTFAEWLLEEWTILVPILLVGWLHPRREEFFTNPSFDRPMLGLTVLATVPWLVFAVTNARLQLINAPGDSHAEMEHWAVAALLGVVVIVSGFLGSSNHDGWRLPAWIAVGGSVIVGVHSLVFPGLASSLAIAWDLAAIVWGVAYGAAIVRRSRAGTPSEALVPGALQ